MQRIPILQLGEYLLTSIQVDLTDRDVNQFQEDALNIVARTDAKAMAIDITALGVVDSYMARVLNDTADMISLLGLEVVICGMQPEVAITLTEMGRELVGVETALNLERGLEKLKDAVARREHRDG